MKSLVDLFPIIFEIPKDDVAWYDSLGMCDDAYYEEFESSAKEYAMMAVENPHENMDAVDATSYRFVSGASWYACNKRLLENLSDDDRIKAIYMAICLWAKNLCKGVEPDEDWNICEADTFYWSVRSDFGMGLIMVKDGEEEYRRIVSSTFLLKR